MRPSDACRLEETAQPILALQILGVPAREPVLHPLLDSETGRIKTRLHVPLKVLVRIIRNINAESRCYDSKQFTFQLVFRFNLTLNLMLRPIKFLAPRITIPGSEAPATLESGTLESLGAMAAEVDM